MLHKRQPPKNPVGRMGFFIRLRQNTVQLAAGMIGRRQRLWPDKDGEVNHGEAREGEDGLASA
ncbi:MAG: hypothetical protein ABIG67_09715 [Pseudomonadota bacterium]